QLNTDCKGLRKDGEIFVVWTARPVDPVFDADDVDGFLRLDRIMFFANGDFQTYHQHQGNIRGNVARVSYMLANRRGENPGEIIPAAEQNRVKRMLARSQHILTADELAIDFRYPGTLGDVELDNWRNLTEYDKISLPEWKNMPWASKKVALATITGVNIQDRIGEGWGARIHPADPLSVHMLLCEGVGEFKIQGWYEVEQRWVPEVDWGDGRTDFPLYEDELDVVNAPGVLYPYPPYGAAKIPGMYYDPNFLTEEHFNEIPGLGRALKFTFTLYDSKGILEGGRTFTHIVYLDD
ncbi:MAG: hypothetical protein ACYS21_10970, partial [Planctomycetota bacterium]